MTIDPYSVCPCGSGKKYKFCKCVDQPAEYERIVRLMDGEQEIAALDRINTLLKKTPNAAWLLALRGELALRLNELELFRENSNRFQRLKPDNPLALIFKSMASNLDHEPISVVVQYLLEGLAESRDRIPMFTRDALLLLERRMVNEGVFYGISFWASLSRQINDEDERNVLSSPHINALLKGPPTKIPSPEDAAWAERLAEVGVLCRGIRFAQAETKLRAILRDYPDQPSLLSELLCIQLWIANAEAALSTARKLASLAVLTDEQRAEYMMLALELDTQGHSLHCQTFGKFYELSSDAEVDRILSENSHIDRIENPQLAEFERVKCGVIVGDEIPATEVFSVFDRPEGASELRSEVGSIALFKKQTDKPARILFRFLPMLGGADIARSILETLPLAEELEFPKAMAYVDYREALRRPRSRGQNGGGFNNEELGRNNLEIFLNFPFGCLNGQSPLEARGQVEKRPVLAGLLRHFEGEQGLGSEFDPYTAAYQELGMERPAGELLPDGKLARLADAARVDVSSMDNVQIANFLNHCMAYAMLHAGYQAAKEIVRRFQTEEEDKPDAHLLAFALIFLESQTIDLEEQLEVVTMLEECLANQGGEVGKAVVSKFRILIDLGRHEEAAQYFSAAFRKYPKDPVLFEIVASQMVQAQESENVQSLEDRIATSILEPRVKPISESGLVLPGQAEPASAQGESKLWLPGT
ncbi:MAG: hypothetical protein KDB03_11125 [Planctomycetales bacterium]|nr:hypothetical protein [Planctomycetales bacterium]